MYEVDFPKSLHMKQCLYLTRINPLPRFARFQMCVPHFERCMKITASSETPKLKRIPFVITLEPVIFSQISSDTAVCFCRVAPEASNFRSAPGKIVSVSGRCAMYAWCLDARPAAAPCGRREAISAARLLRLDASAGCHVGRPAPRVLIRRVPLRLSRPAASVVPALCSCRACSTVAMRCPRSSPRGVTQ